MKGQLLRRKFIYRTHARCISADRTEPVGSKLKSLYLCVAFSLPLLLSIDFGTFETTVVEVVVRKVIARTEQDFPVRTSPARTQGECRMRTISAPTFPST